jgi:hypothetical protein
LIDYKKHLAKLTEKWHIKVLSVVAAIFLFTFHRMGDLRERFFSVPLRLDLNSGLTPGSPYPRSIRVTLRGDANSVYPVTEDDIEAFVDLSMYSEPGVYKAPVRIQRGSTPAETENLEIRVEPMEISVELDVKGNKKVPLAASFQGLLEQGYELVSFELNPMEAVIDGPVKILSGISELSTESIDLRGRNADFSTPVRIINPSPLLTIRGGASAEFSGFIRELIMIRNFEELPVAVKDLAGGFTAELHPPTASARILGVQRRLNEFTGEGIFSVDCSAIEVPGSYELPLAVTVEEELIVERKEPETIRVEVRRGEE